MGHDTYRTLYKSRILHMPYMYKDYVNDNNLVLTIMCVFDFETIEVCTIAEGQPGGYGNPSSP